MKYAGMPMGMWVLFGGSFRKHLSLVYGYDPETAKAIAAKAKPKYKEIIGRLPEFEKADRFKMNIVNCAMLSSFLLSLPERPTVEKTTAYYLQALLFLEVMNWYDGIVIDRLWVGHSRFWIIPGTEEISFVQTWPQVLKKRGILTLIWIAGAAIVAGIIVLLF